MVQETSIIRKWISYALTVRLRDVFQTECMRRFAFVGHGLAPRAGGLGNLCGLRYKAGELDVVFPRLVLFGGRGGSVWRCWPEDS